MKLVPYRLREDVLPCWKRMISVQAGQKPRPLAIAVVDAARGMCLRPSKKPPINTAT